MNPETRSQLTIREAQRRVDAFVRAKGEEWSRLSNHHLRVNHLVEEVGELARAVINLDATYGDPNRRDSGLSRVEKLSQLEDSLGDVLYVLFGISIAYGVDLADAFEASMKNITARYPVAPPTEALNPEQ